MKPRRTSVIIVAAGSGSRFGKPKQLATLLGKPLYLHSLDTFASHSDVSDIILVVSDDIYEEVRKKISSSYPYVHLVLGGATRQESVSNAIRFLGEGSTNDISDNIILVHDAARPCVSAEIITNVIRAASLSHAALAATPVVDTLKREESGVSIGTVSREHLWRAQTPQAATYKLLADAIAHAEKNNINATDEAELLEHIGIHASIVLGSEENIKVTYPEDIVRVEQMMSGASR